MPKEVDVKSNLDVTLQALKKKYGEAVRKGNELHIEEIERISTGSLAIDIETGGGLPCGRIVEIFGPESSGKTAVALKAIADAQKRGKSAVFIDVEHTFDPRWAKVLGVDVTKLNLLTPETAEQAGDMLEAVVRSGDCGIVVLDSIAAMMPSSELEKSIEGDPEKIGERAQLMGRVMRKLQAALNTYSEDGVWNDCLAIFINQTRDKIGVMWGSPETTPGGRAVAFHASLLLVDV